MADSDIEIQKYYERIRSVEANLNFVKRQVAALSTIGTVTKSNSLDSSRFNAHVGDALIHFRKETIELKDLLDTLLADPPADKEFLTYKSSTNKWINRTQHEAISETKFFIGTCIEKFHALVTSAGGVITLTLTEVNAGDLTMLFTDGYTTLATSGSITIVLTAGTDANPQTNYIYILQSGKVLAKSTSAWPATEHIKIGYFVVPSAVFVQNNNVYVNQNWNEGTDVQGHFTDMAQKMRQFGADYFSGIDPVVANNSDYLDIAVGNVEFKSQAGVVWQIHPHTFGAFDTSGGNLVLVKNWNGDSYHDITDLFDIVDDSAGVSLANKWFKMVIWGIGNKEGELDYIVINLPSGSYTTEAKATEDKNKYTDYAIPRQYSIESSTGFLICEIVVKQAATWLYGSTKDLRGLASASAVAGAVGTGITDHESLTSIGSVNHATIDSYLDQAVKTSSSPTFVSPVVSTSLLPDASGGADIGSASLEFGDIFLADNKDIKFGSDQDWEMLFSGHLRLRTTGPNLLRIQNIGVGSTGNSPEIRLTGNYFDNPTNYPVESKIITMAAADPYLEFQVDDDNVSNSLVTILRLFDDSVNIIGGNLLMDGSTTDDERLRVPYLTQAPASVDNSSIWMEADGLHIYYNGAEKLVAGV